MLYDVSVTCPFCFESFWIGVDAQGGDSQDFIQDCDVCCRPIEIHAEWNESSGEFTVEADRSQ